jgi:hypothetical protein
VPLALPEAPKNGRNQKKLNGRTGARRPRAHPPEYRVARTR